MPALPQIQRHAADSRILDSRQLLSSAAQSLSSATTASFHKLARSIILPRQSGGLPAIPQYYQYSGPSPGAVVGIVLGSVAGFLLLMWLFWSLSQGNTFLTSNRYEEEDVVVRRRSRSPRSHRSRRTEMSSRSPPARRERVIRTERIVRDIPPPREPSRIRETVIVEDLPPRMERRVDGDDIVEVIEEHSSLGGGGAPPPRRKTRRSGGGYRRGEFSDL
ncbi:hypothetical protein BAUCODRAFT_493994 [Baudoinia panamericana UAMH 10762]|uniref:Uncharacterized protein n=1 Tax=Baudoinia panamericana (strain UAMH 10762) TaxID=717646 RepID=M2MG15_BAUPA|nr:uncharacterized protein BAUCODRAFT_493994 [Baudoinia panamericana UAMH 10762]EMC95561.1 hypothetical protein BAUCODRAFT_493994 [Baudoinia panamericana UAMH 10762]